MALTAGVCARADDAQNAAAVAAAAQAAVAGGAGGAAGAAGAAAAAQTGTSGGHFERALSAPKIPVRRASPQKSKKTRKKKGVHHRAVRARESRYKSRVLSERTQHSYLFDENGNPVVPKVRSSAKKKKKKAAPSDDSDDNPGACSTDEPCKVQNPDADAL